MKIKELFQKKKSWCSVVLLLAGNAGFCTLIGMFYIFKRVFSLPTSLVLDILIPLSSSAASAYIASQWYFFCILNRTNKKKLYVPAVFSAIIYISVVAVTKTSHPVTFVVCVLYGTLNTLLMNDLKNPTIVKKLQNRARKKYPKTDDKELIITNHSRRFTMMVPLNLITLNHVLFGCGIALSIIENWFGAIVYVCIFSYYITWKATLYAAREFLNPYNVMFLLGVIVICGILRGLSLYSEYFSVASILYNSVLVSIYIGVTIAIYELLELAQILRGVTDDFSGYNDQMRAISVMIGVSHIIMTIYWWQLQLPLVHYVAYVSVSAFYVMVHQYRYDKWHISPYQGSILSTIFHICLTSGLFLLGMYGVFPYAWLSFPEIPMNLSLVETIVSPIVAVIIRIIENKGTKKAEIDNNENDHLRGYRLIHWHIIYLLICIFFIGIMCWIFNLETHLPFAMITLSAFVAIEIGVYFYMRNGGSFFNPLIRKK